MASAEFALKASGEALRNSGAMGASDIPAIETCSTLPPIVAMHPLSGVVESVGDVY